MIETSALILSGVAIFCFLVGIVIGVAGVGGILIIPFLIYAIGYDIHTVIPAGMAGFCLAAITAVYSYGSRGSIRWDKALYLMIGAAPGAYLGSFTLWFLPGWVLEVFVCTLVVISGIRSLRNAPVTKDSSSYEKVPNLLLVILGFLVGYGSSLSGTGGPLLLIPSLLLLNFPVLTAVGLSMAIQIPIAPFATLGHIFHGAIDWVLAAPIGIGIASGVLIGAAIAHSISTHTMQRVVAVVLLVCGVVIALQFVF